MDAGLRFKNGSLIEAIPLTGVQSVRDRLESMRKYQEQELLRWKYKSLDYTTLFDDLIYESSADAIERWRSEYSANWCASPFAIELPHCAVDDTNDDQRLADDLNTLLAGL